MQWRSGATKHNLGTTIPSRRNRGHASVVSALATPSLCPVVVTVRLCRLDPAGAI